MKKAKHATPTSGLDAASAAVYENTEMPEPTMLTEYRRRLENPASSTAWDWLRLSAALDDMRRKLSSTSDAYRVLARAAADCDARGGI